MQPISIILADAHHLVRAGYRHLLTGENQFIILAEASNEEELMEQLNYSQPDVLILDYFQPGYFDFETLKKVKEKVPGTKLLIVSSDHDKSNIFSVLETGVRSFLTKTCDGPEILDAIEATAKGEKFFCTKVIDYLLEKSFPQNEENCSPTPLSPREIEIVRLIAKGMVTKEIADTLHLSPHTIYTHRKNIMRKLKKLNINSSSELVIYAVNKGIVETV